MNKTYDKILPYLVITFEYHLVRRCGPDHIHVTGLKFDTLSALHQPIQYIDSHLDSGLTLDRAAAAAMMNKTYFCGLFKKYNGLSPWNYITIKRVEMAIRLLETTEYANLEITSKYGFCSSPNFYKAFRKVTGKRPGDYMH